MQQIGRKARKNHVAADRADTLGLSGVSGVLPRLFRRPARYFHRLLGGGFYLTPKSMFVFGSCFVVAIVAGGIIAGGKQEVVAAKVASFNVLTVKHYDISGNREISDVEVVKLLAPKNGETLFGYDVKRAREDLRRNPWVFDATVAKVYPNKVAVNIEERSAFGVLQQADKLKLVDRDGIILADFDGRRKLPLFVGEGAGSKASVLMGALNRYPDIATQVKAHVWISNRRWDLILENGVRVMLPEHGFQNELVRLSKLNNEEQIFDRDVARIDLRQSDRMVLKLNDGAAKLREEMLENSDKSLKTAINRRHL